MALSLSVFYRSAHSQKYKTRCVTSLDGSTHLGSCPAVQPLSSVTATRNVSAFLSRLLIKPATISGFHLLEMVQMQSWVNKNAVAFAVIRAARVQKDQNPPYSRLHILLSLLPDDQIDAEHKKERDNTEDVCRWRIKEEPIRPQTKKVMIFVSKDGRGSYLPHPHPRWHKGLEGIQKCDEGQWRGIRNEPRLWDHWEILVFSFSVCVKDKCICLILWAIYTCDGDVSIRG